MKSLIVYDSTFGNTKKIAEEIAKELGKESKAVFISDFDKKMLKDVNLLIVGSPIIGWKPTEKTAVFLESLEKESLKGVKASSFDTRVKLFIHGDAMKKMASKLKSAGAEIFVKPHAFYVNGKEGPLLEGEKEKAVEWAKEIKKKF